MTVYTSGDWYVKAGREEDFANKWQEIAGATTAEIEATAPQILLRDVEDPRHFRTFGRWENEEAIVRWRDGSVFGARIGELYELLEVAAPSVFDIVTSLGSPGVE